MIALVSPGNKVYKHIMPVYGVFGSTWLQCVAPHHQDHSHTSRHIFV